MGQAFHCMLERLLKPYGFLFLDPLHPKTRQLAAPMLEQAVRMGPDLNKLLLQRNQELESAGYHAQVHVEPTRPCSFFWKAGNESQSGNCSTRRNSSPNARNSCRPTRCCGPSCRITCCRPPPTSADPRNSPTSRNRRCYMKGLLGHMPRLVSRSGFTLFDSRAAKLMERYQLRPKDFFHGEEAVRERIASRFVPEGLDQRFEEVTASTEQNSISSSGNPVL